MSIMHEEYMRNLSKIVWAHKKPSGKSLALPIELALPICYISIRKGESDVQMKYPAAHGMCIAGAGAANQNMQEDSAHRVDLAWDIPVGKRSAVW